VILIARLIRDETMHELVRRDDGTDEFHTFIRDHDMDRPATPQEAAEFCDTVGACGGEVRRRVTSWPRAAVKP
jgi:hypothetical protein